MDENFSNLMEQVNQMIKNNDIPDEIQNLMKQFSSTQTQHNENTSSSSTSSATNKTTFTEKSDKTTTPESNRTTTIKSDNNTIPELDIATIMKIKKIIDSTKETQNDPRANLLKSLKPYLKESRKEKVDQYIQLFGMSKALEMFGSLGGDKKQ